MDITIKLKTIWWIVSTVVFIVLMFFLTRKANKENGTLAGLGPMIIMLFVIMGYTLSWIVWLLLFYRK